MLPDPRDARVAEGPRLPSPPQPRRRGSLEFYEWILLLLLLGSLGLAIATTLVPHIGYDAAALIAKEAQQTGKTIMEVAKLKTDISESDLNKILDPISMTVRGNTSGPSSG